MRRAALRRSDAGTVQRAASRAQIRDPRQAGRACPLAIKSAVRQAFGARLSCTLPYIAGALRLGILRQLQPQSCSYAASRSKLLVTVNVFFVYE